jgi:adenylate kinase family enzyme
VTRIVVIGCGGSGKSLLARRLGQVTGAPVVHLDGVHYDADWNPLPAEEFAARQRELVAGTRWVIDGNYASTLPIRLAAADVVILLDLPAATCLWGILRRRIRYRGGQHPEVGVYDRVNLSFVRYIIGYRRTMAPRVRRLVAEHAPDAQFHAPRSRRQIRRLTRRLADALTRIEASATPPRDLSG